MTFWPDDVVDQYVQSPSDILNAAGAELESRVSEITWRIQQIDASDRTVLKFRLSNTQYDMAINLFEVSHRVDQTYPVVIHPPVERLPSYLMRERTVAGGNALARSIAPASVLVESFSNKKIENPWVCGTPQEFREKLQKLLNLDSIKWRVLSLRAPAAVTPPPVTTGDAEVDEVEHDDQDETAGGL